MRDLGQDRREKSEDWSDVSLAVDCIRISVVDPPNGADS
jgi:hypothetical protein